MLEVTVTAAGYTPDMQTKAARCLERLLGLDTDLSAFYRFASGKKELDVLVKRFRGVKPPRFLTLFETLANGFIFQQISLAAGITLLNHLVETYGPTIPGGSGHAFPSSQAISTLKAEDLRAIGFSRQKGRALIELSDKVVSGLDLEQLNGMSDDEAIGFLYNLRGVGRWTAQYCLLRGLGRLNVFPGDDIGAKNKVKDWLGLDKVPDYEEMQGLSSRWHPYAGMVYFHLLLNRLEERGCLAPALASKTQ